MDTPRLDKILALAAGEVRAYARRGPKGHMEHVREFRRMTPDEQYRHLTDMQEGHNINPLILDSRKLETPEGKRAALLFHSETHKHWAAALGGVKGGGKDVIVHQRLPE
jgi:hypothetical protein